MVTGIISADQRPTLETGPSRRNRGDRAYHHKRKIQINHNRFLGYTKDADGNLIIDPEQAEIVKRIYREYLEGLSMDKIAAGLERDGILTGAGGKSGTQAPSTKFSETRNTSVMPCFKRPTLQTF